MAPGYCYKAGFKFPSKIRERKYHADWVKKFSKGYFKLFSYLYAKENRWGEPLGAHDNIIVNHAKKLKTRFPVYGLWQGKNKKINNCLKVWMIKKN